MSRSSNSKLRRRAHPLEDLPGLVAQAASLPTEQNYGPHRATNSRSPVAYTSRSRYSGIRDGRPRTERRWRSSPRCRCTARVPARAARPPAPPMRVRTAPLAATPPPIDSRSRPVAAKCPLDAQRQRLDDRPLIGGGQVGPPLQRLGLAKIAHLVHERGLQPGEREIQPGQTLRGREGKRAGITLSRQPLERRAARVAEAEQPSPLVERLAGGVVERLAEHLVARPAVGHPREQGVPAARDQRSRTAARTRSARGTRPPRDRASGRRRPGGARTPRPVPWRWPRRPAAPPPDRVRTSRRPAPPTRAKPRPEPAHRRPRRRSARDGGARRSPGQRRRSGRARPARRSHSSESPRKT